MAKSVNLLASRPIDTRRSDSGLIISIILLFALGLFTLYSSSESYAVRAFGDSMYFVKRQLISMVVGLVLMITAACIPLEFIRKCLPYIYLGTLLLCLLTFLPGIGDERNGASRWIKLPGLGTFQPSEAAKVTVVLFLANLFDKKGDRLDDPKVSVYPAALGVFVFVIVIFLQNDFSTSIFVLGLALLIFLLAGIKWRWFVAFALFAVPLGLMFIFVSEYRVNRLIAFLRPDYDIQGINYQLNASQRAISAGGLWGSGFGVGLEYVKKIPEVQSDFIFAGWTEAMGLFGVILYFGVLFYFEYRCIVTALTSDTRFKALLVSGLALSILAQSLLNCGVVSGALPSTGIPLPFFSSGGSSLLMTMIACGLIINVSQSKNSVERAYE